MKNMVKPHFLDFLKPPSLKEIFKDVILTIWFYPLFSLKLRRELKSRFGSHLKKMRKIFMKIKLMKRFLRGAYLGYMLSKYLCDIPGISNRIHILNAEIYGFWGVTIIATDHALDSGLFTIKSAKSLFACCLQAMHDKHITVEPSLYVNEPQTTSESKRIKSLVDFPNDDRSYLPWLVVGLAESIRQRVERLEEFYHSMAPEVYFKFIKGREEFEVRSKDLLKGQLRSAEQSIVDDDHNWAWYYRSILNHKTLNFFFAPLSLYRQSQRSDERHEIMKRRFLLLNHAYCHWQLVDDVSDLLKDTREGLVSAPGYILVSQGQLAEQLEPILIALNCYSEASGNLRLANIKFKVLSLVVQSSLLTEEFWPALKCKALISLQTRFDEIDASVFTTEQVTTYAKYALANKPSELELTLNELCARRICQKGRFVKAMISGDVSEALKAIADSDAAFRVLSTISNRERALKLRNQLIVDDAHLSGVLRTLERLMRHTYTKALVIVRDLQKMLPR